MAITAGDTHKQILFPPNLAVFFGRVKMHAFLKGGKISSEPKSKDKPKSDKAGASGEGKPTKKNIPWVEKYRPKNVDEVSYQDEVVAVLKKSLQSGDLPNLLFYGPPGTGKTSTILAAARQLFGNDMFRSRVLELNASDERGINVIRDKVKVFSQLSASAFKPDGKPCPPFKIVILDEADSMTKPAQAALRRTMEKESKTTRFCLICNYVSRIIAPITSRCAKFRFKPLDATILQVRLKEICDKESLQYDQKTIDAVVKTSGGDLRKAITYLQSSSRLKINEVVEENDIYEIAGIIPNDIITNIFKSCYSDSYEKLDKHIKDMVAEGYSAGQFLSQIHDHIVPLMELSDKAKSAILEKVAIVDQCLLEGADEYLQMMGLCTFIMREVCHGEN